MRRKLIACSRSQTQCACDSKLIGRGRETASRSTIHAPIAMREVSIQPCQSISTQSDPLADRTPKLDAALKSSHQICCVNPHRTGIPIPHRIESVLLGIIDDVKPEEIVTKIISNPTLVQFIRPQIRTLNLCVSRGSIHVRQPVRFARGRLKLRLDRWHRRFGS